MEPLTTRAALRRGQRAAYDDAPSAVDDGTAAGTDPVTRTHASSLFPPRLIAPPRRVGAFPPPAPPLPCGGGCGGRGGARSRFGELSQFGLPIEKTDPLTRMCRAECLLALHLMRGGAAAAADGGIAVDFVDADKMFVLQTVKLGPL